MSDLVPNILTVDVEDWFHILEVDGGYQRADWDGLESRVERNTEALLEMFEGAGSRGTFFIVGWVAERFPALVRRIVEGGHEVGSHSYGHEVVPRLTREEFAEDIRRSKAILEDTTGQPVLGYRAPGGSITADTTWAWTEIAAAGFSYDSSVWPPLTSSHGGVATPYRAPHRLLTPAGPLDELPISTFGTGSWQVPYAGGGYLRLFPYGLIRLGVHLDNREQRPANVYVHPREIDVGQPRMELPLMRRFKYYVGLSSTKNKLRRLIESCAFVPARDWIEQHRAELDSRVHDLGPGPQATAEPQAIATQA